MPVLTLPMSDWRGSARTGTDRALESGAVVHLPSLRFTVCGHEREIFSPGMVGTAKNVSYEPTRGRVSGTVLAGEPLAVLAGMLERFSRQAAALVDILCPSYRGRIDRGRASFRPVEIEARPTSWRKDDTRLHIDSFPASPVQGRRILRLFSNVNPSGKPRVWRVGEEGFETLARRFAPTLRPPMPGSAALLKLLRVTKTSRSAYDAMMLQLHDRMKQDGEFQASSPQSRIEFGAGSTWVAFSDQVAHAAMSGQYQLEQTFLLPVDAMIDRASSPLAVLERMTGRRLT